MTVAQLLREWSWEEMKTAPGRFQLAEPSLQPSVEELLGPEAEVRTVPSAAARETIVLAELEDGGLISYRRADGTWVHTLNTRSRYRRRLWELGIERPPRPAFWDEGEE